MNIRVLWTSLRVMGRFKFRNGLMMLGTLIGVAALSLVMSVGKGAEQKILVTVRNLFGANSVALSSGGGMILRGPRSDGARLTMDDMDAIAKQLPGIEAWDPVQVIPNTALRQGDHSTSALVLGNSERFERVWNRGVTQGKFFSARDVAQSARVAVIGATVARDLFGQDDPIGAQILVGSVPFEVVGLLEPMGTDAHGMDRDNELVVPISTAMRRLQNVDTIRGARLLVKDPNAAEQIAQDMRGILRERHGLSDGYPDDFTIMTPLEVQKMVHKARRVLFVFLPLAAGICMLAGSVVAAMLMLLSVNDRKAEIGLRRAVGARPRDIALQFLCETTLVALLGGVGGVAVGCTGAILIARAIALPEFFSWPAILLSLGLAALTGLVAGVLPARRAALLHPAEALR